ncbi:hypothetical protein LTR85_010247 [Meristemomyces frigidus]|nr:hypothetical protein LTR85_010247 [Meristemomyces frigidus]
MALGNLMFTFAGDGIARGTKTAKPARKKATKKSGSATPAASTRDTPVSAVTQGNGANSHANASREPSGSPLFDFSDEDDDRAPVKPVARQLTAPTPTNEEIVNTIEGTPTANAQQPEDERDAVILDPRSSERQYYRDPFTGYQREIWRPGDGDGEPGADYYERPGQLPPVAQRWRFYQVKTGDGPMQKQVNVPPKYVILDDRAAYEVFASGIPKTTSVKFWSHDFGGAGKLRARRPHRGRGATRDPDAEGDDKYHTAQVGMKNDKYYFTGEKEYKPIIYRIAAPEAVAAETPVEQSRKRKATSPATDEPRDLRKHGHNQYTPKEELVKYGAPTSAKGRDRYRARINTFLRRSPTPPFSKDRSKLYGGIGDLAHSGMASTALQGATGASMALQGIMGTAMPKPAADEGEDSMWVDQDEDVPAAEAEEDQPRFTSSDDASARTRPIELPDDTSSDASPFTRLANNVQSPELEVVPATAEDAIELPRRTKLPQPMSFMERMAATEEADVDTSPREKAVVDSGSYATQLERELVEANSKIDSLASAFEQAQARIEELEGEAAALRDEIDAGKDYVA